MTDAIVTGTSASAGVWTALALALALASSWPAAVTPAQQWVTETRDPKQTQDEDFAKAYARVDGRAAITAARSSTTCRRCRASRRRRTCSATTSARPQKLTYYADILKYYRALAAATPRVKVETIGKSDEDRELVVVWVSSDANIKNLQQNRDNLAQARRPARAERRADQAADRHDQAALPPDGRPAQRRDRARQKC